MIRTTYVEFQTSTTIIPQGKNMREELLQQILRSAKSINNAAMLCKVTSSLITQVRKCIQADGGHFETCLSDEQRICNYI